MDCLQEVAFYFAWLELYCVWLKFPAIMGILAFIIQFSYPSILVGYCGCIIIWSTAFLEFWKRREVTRTHLHSDSPPKLSPNRLIAQDIEFKLTM